MKTISRVPVTPTPALAAEPQLAKVRDRHLKHVHTRRATIRIAIAMALSCAAAVAAAPSASAAPAPSTHSVVVSGTWTDPDPLTITNVTPHGAAVLVDATGASHWSGSLNGDTSFAVRAVIAPTGSAAGVITETFDGSVAGVGTGELRFAEAFHQAPNGTIKINAVTVSGTGGLARVHATLHFTGQTAASGVGGGSYFGVMAS